MTPADHTSAPRLINSLGAWARMGKRPGWLHLCLACVLSDSSGCPPSARQSSQLSCLPPPSLSVTTWPPGDLLRGAGSGLGLPSWGPPEASVSSPPTLGKIRKDSGHNVLSFPWLSPRKGAKVQRTQHTYPSDPDVHSKVAEVMCRAGRIRAEAVLGMHMTAVTLYPQRGHADQPLSSRGHEGWLPCPLDQPLE